MYFIYRTESFNAQAGTSAPTFSSFRMQNRTRTQSFGSGRTKNSRSRTESWRQRDQEGMYVKLNYIDRVSIIRFLETISLFKNKTVLRIDHRLHNA